MPEISVAVVEDDVRLRQTVARVLAQAGDCRCVGMFATAADAIRCIPALSPEVILMDVNLPDSTGMACVAVLAPKVPNAQILMVTVYQDPEIAFEAIAAGAHGYLVKPVLPERLVEAIREIRGGGVPMSPAVARRVIDAFREMKTASAGFDARRPAVATGTELSAVDAPGRPADELLAPREQQVLELLVEGYSYKETASHLGISIGTVSTYVHRIYEKLHVSSRREMVARSRGSG